MWLFLCIPNDTPWGCITTYSFFFACRCWYAGLWWQAENNANVRVLGPRFEKVSSADAWIASWDGHTAKACKGGEATHCPYSPANHYWPAANWPIDQPTTFVSSLGRSSIWEWCCLWQQCEERKYSATWWQIANDFTVSSCESPTAWFAVLSEEHRRD